MSFYVGQTDSFAKTVTESDVYNFAGISGDFNSVHVNRIEAERSIFKRQVAHGMLGAAFISTTIGMRLPGPGTIYMAQNLKFVSPIYIGDTITATVRIVEIDEEKRRATLDTVVTNQDDQIVITGQAKVKLPPDDEKD